MLKGENFVKSVNAREVGVYQERESLPSLRPALAFHGWSRRLLCGVAVLGVALSSGLWLAASAYKARSSLKSQYQPPPSIPFPSENPFTTAKADLGRALFFDKRLSGSQTMACASCHQPGQGWGDGRSHPVEDGGQVMALRTPTLIDDAWTPLLGWDGKFADLESVTHTVLQVGGTMNLDEEAALEQETELVGEGEAPAADEGDAGEGDPGGGDAVDESSE